MHAQLVHAERRTPASHRTHIHGAMCRASSTRALGVPQVTSLGELSSPSIVLFDAIQARVKELGDQLSPQQRKDIKSAYQALGYDGHADAAGV